ncbi:isochorismatase family protein [Longispora urticae]
MTTALLVVDAQNGALDATYARDAVVANIADLVARARRQRVPVVWVRHSDRRMAPGSVAWRIVPELAPDDGEPLVDKENADSFERTTLDAVLSGLGVRRLLVVGAQTDVCVRATLDGALTRGYDTLLVSDAHTMSEPATGSAREAIAATNRSRSPATVTTRNTLFPGT